MKLVIDTNKLIASLLRNGKTRRILLHPDLEFYAPPYVFEEIEEHRDKLLRKVPKRLFEAVMKEAKKKIHVVEPVEPYTSKAKALANDFDPDDYPFIALALQLDIPIWTIASKATGI